MEKLINKLKDYLKQINNKELIRNLFIILVIGIILIIVANIFIEQKKELVPKEKVTNDTNGTTVLVTEYETVLENKLELALNKLKGVGEVKVMITLEDTIERIPAFNTTQSSEVTNELDSQGGTRETTREDKTIQVVTESEGSLIVLKEIKPTVKGVIIIAEGAGDLEVKEKLYVAAKTVLGISGNRVEVYASK